jgi:hypothetical protein
MLLKLNLKLKEGRCYNFIIIVRIMSKHSVLAAVVTLKMLVDRGLELGDLVGVGREVSAPVSSRYIRLAIRQKISYSS